MGNCTSTGFNSFFFPPAAVNGNSPQQQTCLKPQQPRTDGSNKKVSSKRLPTAEEPETSKRDSLTSEHLERRLLAAKQREIDEYDEAEAERELKYCERKAKHNFDESLSSAKSIRKLEQRKSNNASKTPSLRVAIEKGGGEIRRDQAYVEDSSLGLAHANINVNSMLAVAVPKQKTENSNSSFAAAYASERSTKAVQDTEVFEDVQIDCHEPTSKLFSDDEEIKDICWKKGTKRTEVDLSKHCDIDTVCSDEEEEEEEEGSATKEQKLMEIRKSLAKQLDFSRHDQKKSTAIARNALATQLGGVTVGFNRYTQAPLVGLNDESADFSLLMTGGVSKKDSTQFNSFCGTQNTRELKLILDESIIHPVQGGNGVTGMIGQFSEGIDSDTSSKKEEEEIIHVLRKQQSTLELISLLQFPSPQQQQISSTINQQQTTTSTSIPSIIPFFLSQLQEAKTPTAAAAAATGGSQLPIRRLDSFEKKVSTLVSIERPRKQSTPTSEKESTSIQSLTDLSSLLLERRQNSRGSADKRIPDLVSVTEEETAGLSSPLLRAMGEEQSALFEKIPEDSKKKEEFSFCLERTLNSYRQSPDKPVTAQLLQIVENCPVAANNDKEEAEKDLELTTTPTLAPVAPESFQIIVQDPKNNKTEQLFFTINSQQEMKKSNGFSRAASSSSMQSSTVTSRRESMIKYHPHRSLLENTNRIVMQRRSTRTFDSPSTSLIERNQTSDSYTTPKEGDNKASNEMISNQIYHEEEQVQLVKGFQEVEENNLISLIVKRDVSKKSALEINAEEFLTKEDNLQTQINDRRRQFMSSPRTPSNITASQGLQLPKLQRSDSFKKFSNRLSVGGSSPMSCGEESENCFYSVQKVHNSEVMIGGAGENYSKGSSGSGSPNYPRSGTPRDSLRGSVLGEKRFSSSQQIGYYRKQSIVPGNSQIVDREEEQLSNYCQLEYCVIDGQQLQNKYLLEQPELYMKWLGELQPYSIAKSVDESVIGLSSESLYQFEMIKQETYQDFMSKFETEYLQNLDLFDMLIDNETERIYFRSELGLDQQRVFIVTGEYIVNTASYATFYNFKNSLAAQKLLNAFFELEVLNDNPQNTVLVARSNVKHLATPAEFVFLKHFSFLQEHQENQQAAIEQMCEIDISLNSEEIEFLLKKYRKSDSMKTRCELFSGNITTAFPEENKLRVELQMEITLHNAITASQAMEMYRGMFQNYFKALSSAFP